MCLLCCFGRIAKEKSILYPRDPYPTSSAPGIRIRPHPPLIHRCVAFSPAPAPLFSDPLLAAAGHPDAERMGQSRAVLASGSGDGTIKLWVLARRSDLPNPLQYHESGASGEALAAAVCVGTMRGHGSSAVVGLAFSPDGLKLASAAWDRTCRVWEWTSLQMPDK